MIDKIITFKIIDKTGKTILKQGVDVKINACGKLIEKGVEKKEKPNE